VHNLEDTISINQNWFNLSSLDLNFSFLLGRLEAVVKEISDLKPPVLSETEYLGEVEKLLAMDAGLGIAHFVKLIELNAVDLNEADLDRLAEISERAARRIRLVLPMAEANKWILRLNQFRKY
jgi:hypothetical protein